jgi:hypothetical protein
MASKSISQGTRKVATEAGAGLLLFGCIFLPSLFVDVASGYRLLFIVCAVVGVTTLSVARVSVDPRVLLVKRILAISALGAITGYLAYAAAWAKLLSSWPLLIGAAVAYVALCWGLSRLVDLRIDKWESSLTDTPPNNALERERDQQLR